jgi:hypothetical protein
LIKKQENLEYNFELVVLRLSIRSMNALITIKGVAWKIGDRTGTDNDSGRSLDGGGVFLSEFKNLGRLDPVSRAVATVLAQLLAPVGLYPSDSKHDIPLLVSSESGFSHSDIAYFQDFVDYGESAGRANLFVYTLPTSPLADASVHFGLTGGISYIESSSSSSWNALVGTVADSIAAADEKGVAVPSHHILVVAEEYRDGADAFAALLSTDTSSDAEGEFPPRRLGDYATIAELKQLMFT